MKPKQLCLERCSRTSLAGALLLAAIGPSFAADKPATARRVAVEVQGTYHLPRVPAVEARLSGSSGQPAGTSTAPPARADSPATEGPQRHAAAIDPRTKRTSEPTPADEPYAPGPYGC